MRYFIFSFVLMVTNSLSAQSCKMTLQGRVQDAGTGEPLEFVNVFLKGENTGTYTDSLGFFELKNLCAGHFHLVLSHVGCEPKQVFFDLNQDTTLQLRLEHSVTALHGVTVTEHAEPMTAQHSETVSAQHITDNADENLSNLLSELTGVSTLRNGNAIAKPVVHGLYGNRVAILNNGIAQSGQQWGNDHSPEIDPLVANKIRVVKGTGALEYMGSNLGGVVLVEPQKISREPHLNGRASSYVESNGRGFGGNVQLQQYSPKLAWKANGTLKKSGDRSSPNYYLNNTGNTEANLAVQLEKHYADRLFFELYGSSFNTTLGVLRGSHIGNLSNLEAAFLSQVPFYTEENFSYKIEAPRQTVNHQLLKFNARYYPNDKTQWETTLAGQFNNRKEFDVRRSGRTDIPALSLQQYNIFFEGKYKIQINSIYSIKSGLQFNYTDNTNNPETGIFPLIPDYISAESGAYFIAQRNEKSSTLEFGLRYDNNWQDVPTFTRTVPVQLVRYSNVFHNFGSNAGWAYRFKNKAFLQYSLGFATRNPAINELYSNGLHQGVSGIEEGNVALKNEKSLKSTLSFHIESNEFFSFEALGYIHRINDYIFLDPQDEIRLTIRGAFPVFNYTQTNAQIIGFDFSGRINYASFLYSDIKYSFVEGDDLTNDLPLVFMPSNALSGSFDFEAQKPLKIGKRNLENLAFGLNNRYVFRQNHLQEEQDFLPPPDSYFLLNAQAAVDVQFNRLRLRFSLKIENALDTTYRDYLNRQRYFADDLGRNVVLGATVKF